MSDQKKILIVDDQENMRHMLAVLLSDAGYRVDMADNGKQAYDRVQSTIYDVVLCDLKMPVLDGVGFLDAARDQLWDSTVIMMSAYGTVDTAVEAMKHGAYDYISKPFKTDEVLMALRKAEERESLKRENTWLKERIRQIQGDFTFGEMVGHSQAMQHVFNIAAKASQYDTTVLITGASGTGKELVARAVHSHGKCAQGAMVPVNCGAIPENLLESELFGYEKGAFTGAQNNKKGLFEQADGGTIFLDEIGEMPVALQIKLLRVLQESEIRPIGATTTRRISARVIAATSRELKRDVEHGRFREDLFYRLNVFPICVPPLCERVDDIPFLCDHFIARFNNRFGCRISAVAKDAMRHLLSYTWPGNVRELENAIQRAMVLAESSILTIDCFDSQIIAGQPVETVDTDGYSMKKAQKRMERKMIERALKKTGGNRTHAARLLEISHPSLLQKIKRYDLG